MKELRKKKKNGAEQIALFPARKLCTRGKIEIERMGYTHVLQWGVSTPWMASKMQKERSFIFLKCVQDGHRRRRFTLAKCVILGTLILSSGFANGRSNLFTPLATLPSAYPVISNNNNLLLHRQHLANYRSVSRMDFFCLPLLCKCATNRLWCA